MATLPSIHPSLSLHLSDRALTPILSSSSNSPQTSDAAPGSHSSTHESLHEIQADALADLTTTSVAAYDTASRLGLGLPQRIMVESVDNGPVIVHSYISPPRSQSAPMNEDAMGAALVKQTRALLRPVSQQTDVGAGQGGQDDHYGRHDISRDDEEEEESEGFEPPLLIATVIAPSGAEAVQARRATTKLERIGREFQRQWQQDERQRREAAQEQGEEDDSTEDG